MIYKIYDEDCLKKLDEIEENTIDSIVTDPPYELNFMGKGWDNAGISFNKETWEKCLRVLKPGGHLLAFGGSRTHHRIAVAIEDAGFEIRDTIMWLYGSGFPKSMALDKSLEAKLTTGSGNKKDFYKCNGTLEESKGKGYTSMKKTNVEQDFRDTNYKSKGQIQLEATTELAKKYKGWGTCLKPSFEPIIVARKPFKGSLVDNVIQYGVGGINIDECRVAFENGEENSSIQRYNSTQQKGNNGWQHINRGANFNEDTKKSMQLGRFPANTILTYDQITFDEVCGGFPYTKGDSGSASRYFYCAKASKKDRDEGLDEFENISGANITGRKEGSAGLVMEDGKQNPFAGKASPNNKNTHPTVKPTELMQYLVRLVTPKGGIILDPFMGSGSTGKAVMYENNERQANYQFIGIEKEKEYCDIAKARIEYVINKGAI